MNKLNIIIPCGLLDKNDKVEIDRYKRFKLQLQNIKSLGNCPSNITWIFCDFSPNNYLKDTIFKYVPNSKYITCFNNNKSFNQILLWKNAILTYPDFDFVIFTHSDILFSKNFYEVLNKRILDENTNYYISRFNLFDYDMNSISDDNVVNDNRTYSVDDVGFEYITYKYDMFYTTVFKSRYFKYSDKLMQLPKLIPESFMCISKKSWETLNVQEYMNYHNDVVIRDLSIVNKINYEWLNDELYIIHLQGLDDILINKQEKNYDSTLEIIKNCPELAHFGMFRFRKDFILYLQNLDKVTIFEKFIKHNMEYPKDLEEWVYDK